MANEFGTLVWESRPLEASATVSYNPYFTGQDGSNSVNYNSGGVPSNYYDWATFEKDTFDFEKPLFTYDPEARAAYTSEILSDENGDLFNGQGQPVVFTVTVTPSQPYSGSGFVIRTYNKNYTLIIEVDDDNGLGRTKTFERTDDEYYPFPYDLLQEVTFRFIKLEPYRFLKVISYDFGETRLLTDDVLVGDPTITNHFSLTNEEFEFDTLDFTIFGNMQTHNIINGERITYTYQSWELNEFKTRSEIYYVADAKYNPDNTIDVTAYDRSVLLDRKFKGLRVYGQSIVDVVSEVIDGAEIVTSGYANKTCTGMIDTSHDNREAARLLLLGTDLCLRKATWKCFQAKNSNDIKAQFDNFNIVSEVNIEKLDRTSSVEFILHRFATNHGDGRTQVYYDELKQNVLQEVVYSQPVGGFSWATASGIKWYYVDGQDADGNDLLKPVTAFYVDPDTENEFGAVVGPGDPTAIYTAFGFPIEETTHSSKLRKDVPATRWFENDETVDFLILKDGNEGDYTDLKENYVWKKSHTNKLSFTSTLNVDTGRRVEVEVNYPDEARPVTYIGFIVTKVNHMDGLYEYEVLATGGSN